MFFRRALIGAQMMARPLLRVFRSGSWWGVLWLHVSVLSASFYSRTYPVISEQYSVL